MNVKPSRYVSLATISHHFSEATSWMTLQGHSADLVVLCFAAPCKINNSSAAAPRMHQVHHESQQLVDDRHGAERAAGGRAPAASTPAYEYLVFFDGDACSAEALRVSG